MHCVQGQHKQVCISNEADRSHKRAIFIGGPAKWIALADRPALNQAADAPLAAAKKRCRIRTTVSLLISAHPLFPPKQDADERTVQYREP